MRPATWLSALRWWVWNSYYTHVPEAITCSMTSEWCIRHVTDVSFSRWTVNQCRSAWLFNEPMLYNSESRDKQHPMPSIWQSQSKKVAKLPTCIYFASHASDVHTYMWCTDMSVQSGHRPFVLQHMHALTASTSRWFSARRIGTTHVPLTAIVRNLCLTFCLRILATSRVSFKNSSIGTRLYDWLTDWFD